MPDIRINELTDPQWDAFVDSQSSALWAHQSTWRSLIARVSGHTTYCFEAWEAGELVGILPTVHVASRMFGNQLVSMPYLDDGGLLATTSTVVVSLLRAAGELADRLRARCDVRSPRPLETNWALSENKMTLRLKLDTSTDAVWKSLPSTRRNRVRKARRNELTASFHSNEEFPAFYDVFSRNMRDLGSPVHSQHFLKGVLSSFPDQAGLILVRDRTSRPVGAGLYVRFRDTMALPWVSCRRDAFHLYPNMLLYWELIQKACHEGAREFDFGRSSVDSGTFEFKRQWGAEPTPLYWYSRSAKGHADGQGINAQSPRQQRFIQYWKRLPVPIANLLGPRLRRLIPL